MRHRVKVQRKSFGRSDNHKKSLLRNLVFDLIQYGRITTTLAKAKELRRHAEKLITLAKKGGLHERRLLLARYPNKKLIADVFNRLAPQFVDRKGGYTRIIKSGCRMGDNANMALIEWVEPGLILSKEDRIKLMQKEVVKLKPAKKAKPPVQPESKGKALPPDQTPEDKTPVKAQVITKPSLWSRLKSFLTPKTKGLLIAFILIVLLATIAFVARNCVGYKDQAVTQDQNILSQLEEVGASNFSLPSVIADDDRLVSLSDLRGTITIVNFWATWCSPCIEEIDSMLKLVDKFQGQVKILAISMDENKSDIIHFMKAFEMDSSDFIILHGNKQIAESWGTWRLPESYILNREHKLIKKVASTENWATPAVFHYFDQLISS